MSSFSLPSRQFAGLLLIILGSVTAPLQSQELPTVRVQPDGLIIAEAEDFAPGNWKAQPWGENYYSATFANTFLSRKGFLGAPEQCDETRAQTKLEIPQAGKYHVLVRYEAAYRFETQFRVVVEQKGKVVLDRLYGTRNNVKIWAFSQKDKTEVAWDWGASENIVWEGHDVLVDLAAGPATLSLIATKQPTPAARRNIDLVMLTTDTAQIEDRIAKEKYLPLDGMLTQSGDVALRVTNKTDKPLKFASVPGKGPKKGNWVEHSPYWVHMRTWQPVTVEVPPQQTSPWVEVGGLMDSLNDGQWNWYSDGTYKVEFAVAGKKGWEVIATFSGEAGTLSLAADADTRRTRRLRKIEQVLYDLLADIKSDKVPGKLPTQMKIYARSFEETADPRYNAAIAEFRALFGIDEARDNDTGTLIDVRRIAPNKLADYCQKFGDAAKSIRVVSLGDEISLPRPPVNDATHEAFRTWLQERKISLNDLQPSGGSDWSQIKYTPDPKLKETAPGVFYWSMRYQYHFGIQSIKTRTDLLRQQLPNAGIGANYSPHNPTEHMFLGEVHKWSTIFREEGMTMPWGEDYIWQVPVGSPQLNNINLDLFRSGIRKHPERPILYYVMPHAPNNTPRMWRRLFYGALGHGMKIVNLFEFRPVQVAYTENHVSDPAMYKMIRRTFHELGTFDDIVQASQVPAADVGLWFSETSDIWGDVHGSTAANKRLLYLALKHQQTALDFVVEADAIEGTLASYRVLYLTDRHVSRAASEKLAAWVKAGGQLIATAGAGMRDEYDRQNDILQTLFGVQETSYEQPEGKQVKFEKQDLAFVEPLEQLSWKTGDQLTNVAVIGSKQRLKLAGGTSTQAFVDGSSAVVQHKSGKGGTTYVAFLMGLAHALPAFPQRPVDRGANDSSYVHFMPTRFHPTLGEFVAGTLATAQRPFTSSVPHVEVMPLQSPKGWAVVLVNWSTEPAVSVKVNLGSIPAGKVVQRIDGTKLPLENGSVTLDIDVAETLLIR